MTRQHGGNAAWRALSDDPPKPAERIVRIDGFSRDVCLICGCYRNWAFGLVRHETEGHVVWHVKFHTEAIYYGNRHILTSLLVDGKAQPA